MDLILGITGVPSGNSRVVFAIVPKSFTAETIAPGISGINLAAWFRTNSAPFNPLTKACSNSANWPEKLTPAEIVSNWAPVLFSTSAKLFLCNIKASNLSGVGQNLSFNSYLDHILLSSQKSINLNSQLSVNIDARSEFVVQTPSVYLGDTQNAQPLVLGNDLVDLLTDLVSDIDSLVTSLSNQVNGPDGTPLAPTSFTAQLISAKIPEYKTRILNTLSNTSNTV